MTSEQFHTYDAIDSADTTNALRRVGIDALFGPVGRHPWVNEAGKVDAAKAGTWMANIILMAGGSPKTAFACALEVATDITDNPAKFKDFAPWPNDNTDEVFWILPNVKDQATANPKP